MQVETTSLFSEVIQDHLALKERNKPLEPQMPLDAYMIRDPFENHPLFKTEEQARIEETMDGAINAEVEAHVPPAEPAEQEDVEDSLWGRSRDFDWGD
ncbi:MAG: hypothetical protein WD249_11680 [Gaiellaceae bacterium]